MGGLTIERVVIDGVPAYVGNQPGPVVAGITFRVGTADESALDRGVTALVAELAAIDVENVEFDVGATLTTFVAKGDAPSVADTLAAVCRGLPTFDDEDLTQLADTILDDPQDIPALQATMLGLRFGAQTYGMVALPPLGLLRVDGAHAREWVARYFTRSGAVLWSSGPLAADIAVALPTGDRIDPPARTDAECEVPSWSPNAWLGSLFRDSVDCSIVAPGTDAARVALRALASEIAERLADTPLRGFEATLDVAMWSNDVTHAALSLATVAHGNDGVECILGSIDDFADLGPDPDELTQAIFDIEKWSTAADNAAPVTEMLAAEELRTGQARTLDEFLGAVRAVTGEQVAAAFDEMRGEIMVATPSDAEIVDPRFSILQRAAGFALDGTRYRRARTTGTPFDDARLTVGAEGVTYATADQTLTACFDDCVAVVVYPDAAIALYDIDGTTIELTAADWRDGEKAFAAIQAAIPAAVTITARRPFAAITPEPETPEPETPEPS